MVEGIFGGLNMNVSFALLQDGVACTEKTCLGSLPDKQQIKFVAVCIGRVVHS